MAKADRARDPEALNEMQERLRAARTALAAVREVVEPLAPPEDAGEHTQS